MSSMIPPSINIGGGDPSGGGAPPAGPGAGATQGKPGPDSPRVLSLMQEAIAKLEEAKGLEGDPGDQAILADLSAKMHKFIGDQHKLVDQATGAGPGTRLIRKAGGNGAAGY